MSKRVIVIHKPQQIETFISEVLAVVDICTALDSP
jgi:hypothetical protein